MSGIAVGVLSLVVVVTPATAAEIGAIGDTITPPNAGGSSASAVDHFREVWDAYGVSQSVQDDLLAAYFSGIPWDSLTGTDPVSETEVVSVGEISTVRTFSDGSIEVVSQQTLNPMPSPGMVSPMADIYGCITISSSQYDNTTQCTVHTNVVVADFAYEVTFYRIQSGYGHIVSVGPISAFCYVGTCSNYFSTITRTYETATLPAKAQGGLHYICYLNTCSRDYVLEFNLKDNAYTALNN